MSVNRKYLANSPTLKDLLRMPRGSAFLLLAALSIIGIWVNLLGYSPLFLESMVDETYYSVGRDIYLLGRVIVALCIFTFYRFFEKHVVYLCATACILLCVVTCLQGFGTHQTLLDPVTVDLASQFLMGISYNFIVDIIIITIARKLRIAYAIGIITASQVIEQVVASGLHALLSSGVITILCIILPLMSFAAFLQARSMSPDITEEKHTGRAAGYHVILSVSAFIALGMLSATSIVGFWGNIRTDYFAEDRIWAFLQTLVACALLLPLCYVTLYRRAHDLLSIRYQPPFLAIIISFFCVNSQALFSSDLVVLDTILLSMEFFSHVFAWTAMVSLIQRIKLSPFRAIGVATIFHAGVWFIWELLSFSPLYSSIFLSAVCCILIVISTLSAPVINGFYQQNKTPTMKESEQLLLHGESPFTPSPQGVNLISSLENRCRVLGKYYGLTEREIDVLALIAQGRTQGRIQKELTLSESTVKTHTGNIFTKMGVHSRQDVLDFVFEIQDSGDT